MSPPKAILVTGCSAGGIGAAIVSTLAKHDHHVFATARNTSKIPEELTSLPNATVLELDVSSTAGYAAPVLDIDIAKAQRVYDVNVWGPVRTIQAFADLLIASRGRIVNLSTVGSVVNTPWISAYASSKAALGNISETLRLELSPFGVSVVIIMAGVVTSQFHENDSPQPASGLALRGY
ncbi:NADPH-dependent 1-acyldihydroxyacetone phosphate reductase [Cytospora mali]|uniref:NADPH-dependent 1-acyldihydroxyacetone phosphate reductase n=1 Tax=Cytospora mali TaxID=578113 RepID=A0A194UWT1_CYTMA|nr:NADPH-dependent 1-acyldihydroxyacetone phosphate reductase [Valsa mali var. pyri (nom. inval.)]